MKVRFWGTRGSLPAALSAAAVEDKLRRATAALAANGGDFDALPFHLRGTYGGNTSCVEIARDGAEHLLLDAGSGLRDFSRHIDPRRPATYHVLLSHTHWDHIMGLPFFVPAYVPGNVVRFYGCHPDLPGRMAAQFVPTHFPVRFDQLGARLEFVRLKPGRATTIAGCEVTPFAQRHPGASYGYRLAADGKQVVYSTDSEHKGERDARAQAFAEFCRGADLLVFDAMYPFAEACLDKAGWGHSSNVEGVELAKKAGVRQLCLFHHDPGHDDEALDRRLEETRRYSDLHHVDRDLIVSMAYDGLEFEV